MASISIRGVTKRFGNSHTALRDLSLEIEDGEFLVLVGPSGCGKSTLLRMVAGLDSISDGEICIAGKIMNDLEPKERDVAMIFQNYALFPHMTVEKNLGFGLRLRRTPSEVASKRIAEAASVLGLTSLMDRYPTQLSGGQRQRVAIGRALVREPVAFLMDEPLANLDTKLRVRMRTEFARLRERLKTTTIYVTHDQIEAMTLGHRVCVMRDGHIQQVDTPHNLFIRPANIFVAGFIGSPEMNFGLAHVESGELMLGQFTMTVPANRDLDAYEGKKVIVGMRPTNFRVEGDHPDCEALEVSLELVEQLGSEVIVVFGVKTPHIHADHFGLEDKSEGDILTHTESEETTFTAQLAGNALVKPGQNLRLGFERNALHFFDPVSGVAIG